MKQIIQVISPAVLVLVIILNACAPASTPTSPTSTSSPIPPTFTPEPTATPTATFTPSATPTPLGGGKSALIVSASVKVTTSFFPELKGTWHIFLVNLDGSGFTPITANLQSYNFLEDVSPDGSKILISSLPNLRGEHGTYGYGDLYVMNVDGTDAVKLSTRFFTRPVYAHKLFTAYWHSENTVVFIAEENNERTIFSIKSDGTELARISNPGSHAVQLFPSPNTKVVYYEAGRRGLPPNWSNGIWKINVDDSQDEAIWNGLSVVGISRLRNRILFNDPLNDYERFVTDFDGNHRVDIDGLNCYPCSSFSPDGTKLIFTKEDHRAYMISLPEAHTTALPDIFPDILLDYLSWSPDSRLIFSRHGETPQIIDSETLEITNLPVKVKIPWSTFLRVYWLPASSN